jgi:hypothetical protein
MRERHDGKGTLFSAKVEQMLIEARVIIPGAQALLGFQLTVTAAAPTSFPAQEASRQC